MPIPQVEFVSKNESGEEVHEYRLDGQVIPSVSQIIAGVKISDYEGVPQKNVSSARERGISVDLACQMYDEDNLRELGDVNLWMEDRLEYPLDEETLSYLRGHIKFRRDWEFTPQLIAKPMSHAVSGMAYGMTADRVGPGGKLGGFAVIDLKRTADIMLSHKVQLAGYKLPFRDKNTEPDVYIEQLFPDGYKLHDRDKFGMFKDRKYEQAFVAALALEHLKMREGM